MLTRIYEVKTLENHISCNCKWKFNIATCNSNQKWNNDKSQCECRIYLHVQKRLYLES